MSKKIKIAIVDLTDCEGCELEILNLKEKILEILDYVDIVNWRLITKNKKYPKLDVALVEGSPLSKEELILLKSVRKKSKYLVSLGACAGLGNFPAMLSEKQRKKYFSKIYSPNYKNKSIRPQPISNFVKVDYAIRGCPPNPVEIEQALSYFIRNLKPEEKLYPVCFACKIRENKCLLLENKPCLGPITQAGCGAACPSKGIPCFGCWGPIKDANFVAMKNRLKKIGFSDQDIKQWISTCWKEIKEFKNFYKDK